jgi:hypothetical protein
MARALRCLAVLLLVPVLAHAQTSEPPSDQGKTAPAANAPPTVPKNLQERTDFALTLTTLDALHKKGAITDEEYNAALRDMIAVGARAAGAPTFLLGRFTTTFYGWLQGDFVHDSQRAASDQYGGNPTLNVAGPSASEGRTAFGARGTRLGVRISGPQTSWGRVTGNVEWDFLGNQPAVTGNVPRSANSGNSPSLSEDSFLTNAAVRIRQAVMKIDTPVVSVWIGQTWDLVAFQAAYLPTSVQYQGLPAQVFGRDPQLRLSRIFDAHAFSLELAAAAVRPAQIDSEIPDFQYGAKLNVDSWKGIQTLGATGTTLSPASVAVSGAVRRFKLQNSLTGNTFTNATGKVVVGDAFLPILPATKTGTLSVAIIAEGSIGSGDGDLFTGLNGGSTTVVHPGITVPAGTADPFQDIDGGLVALDRSNRLITLDWRSALVGLEIHSGPVILAGNYTNLYSKNIEQFGGTWRRQNFWDAALLTDVAPGTRFGIEFARTLQYRLTGQTGKNSRVFASGFFIF